MSMNRIFLIIGLLLTSSHTPADSDDKADTFMDLIAKGHSQLTITKMRGESDTRKTYRVCDRDKCSYFTVSHTPAASDDKADTFIDLIAKDHPQLTRTKMRGESDTRRTYRFCDRDKCSYFTVRKYNDKTQVIYPH